MQAMGAYIKGLRKAQDMTLLDVAMRATPFMGENIDPSYVHKIEKASVKTSPSFKHVAAILSALHGSISVARWLLDDDTMTPAEAERLGRRHAQYVAHDVAWMTDLSEEEQARLRAWFESSV